MAAFSALCGALGLAGIAAGGTATMPLPVGLPGLMSVFSLDAVTLAFLPALGLAGLAASMSAAPGRAGRVGLLMALGVVLVCAGDAGLLVLAAGAAVLALGAGWAERAVLVWLGLAGSLAMLLPHAGLLQSQSLPALRTEALAGAGRWWTVPLALGPVMLMVGGAGRAAGGAVVPVLGLYAAVRLFFDLSGPSTPAASGLLVAAAGLLAACRCGLAALCGDALEEVGTNLAGMAGFVGLGGLGVALTARGADLPEVASATLAGALLGALLLSVAAPLLSLGFASVVEQAGSRRLAALGGLAWPMRGTALAVAGALAVLAGVPPLAGFAPLWLLLQALLSAQRFGGIALPVGLALVLACLGLAVGLGLAASARVFAMVFGGRPRTPRGAAALDARRPALRLMAALSAVLLLFAAVPGLVLRLFGPVAAVLTGAGLAGRAGPWGIAAVAGGQWWSPVPVVLLAAPVAGLVWWSRRWGAAPDEPAEWDGGAAPPPEWLPFGEPLAQPSGRGLAVSALGGIGLDLAHRGQRLVGRDAWASVLRGGRRTARMVVALERGLSAAAPALLLAAIALALLGAVLGVLNGDGRPVG